jgi:hypothetical protein
LRRRRASAGDPCRAEREDQRQQRELEPHGRKPSAPRVHLRTARGVGGPRGHVESMERYSPAAHSPARSCADAITGTFCFAPPHRWCNSHADVAGSATPGCFAAAEGLLCAQATRFLRSTPSLDRLRHEAGRPHA